MAFSGPNPSIWVGGLDPGLNEQKLYEYFVRIGPVASVRVCVDSVTQKSLGYGYVNFQDPADAEKALDQVGSKLGSKYLRIAKVQRDPAKRRSGINIVMVKRLPVNVDTYGLKEMFSKFGRLTAIGLACDENGKSRGYARLSFEREESAAEAVKEMDKMELDGQTITVERYQLQYRDELLKLYTNLYIKNIDSSVNDEKLKAFFSTFGEVTSTKVRDFENMKLEVGFGYVAFAKHEDAEKAVAELNGKECEIAKPGTALDVSRFRSRQERERDRERQRRERAQQYNKYPNLYIKGFDDTVTSEQLKTVFERYGETNSVRVMIDKETGFSRCFGFVSMKEQSAASQAIQELSGSTILCPRPLFVTYALRKDARRQNLEERSKQQFRLRQPPMGGINNMPQMGFMGNQVLNNMNMQFMNPRMPIMPMGGMNNAMRSMGSTTMNQIRAARPLPKHLPPSLPTAQHQNLGFNPRMHQGNPLPPHQNPSTEFANMSSEQVKNMLGERLYVYISSKNPASAAKITGMLLEMDNSEIFRMLENNNILEAKITEAQHVLDTYLAV